MALMAALPRSPFVTTLHQTFPVWGKTTGRPPPSRSGLSPAGRCPEGQFCCQYQLRNWWGPG